jgi:tetratricopeptide (TPR) repeat protein
MGCALALSLAACRSAGESRVAEARVDTAALASQRGTNDETSGLLRSAEAEYRQATELDPDSPDAWRALARVHLALELPREASADLKRAAELGDDGMELHLLWGRVHSMLERPSRAAAAYNAALVRMAEPDVGVLVEIASLATRRGPDRLPEAALIRALGLVELAIEQDPSCAHGWLVQAMLLETLGERARSEASYLRVVEIDDQCLPAWTNLALFRAHDGDREGLAFALEHALELEPDPERRAALAGLARP